MFNDNENGSWHATFNACANSLSWAALKLDPLWPGGMDYVKVNVILFCVLMPAVLLASLASLASLALNLAFIVGWL